MRISREEFRQIARNFGEILDREGIDSLAEVESRLGMQIEVGGQYSADRVTLNMRSSNAGPAHTLSYIRDEVGIPIEMRVSKLGNYSKSIIKFEGVAGRYVPFLDDGRGNLIQERTWGGNDFSGVRKELERLAGI